MILNLILNKYVFGGIVLLTITTAAYLRGHSDATEACNDKAEETRIAYLEAQIKERDRMAAIEKQLSEKLKELRANEKTIEKERIKIVDRPVYRNVCLDDDGLRLVEQARAGAPASDTSGSATRLQ